MCVPLRSHRVQSSRWAFTLLELLVAVAISGILLAILLPAVQQARESSRVAQCQSNLKQLALASLQHESTHRALPSGGWGYQWQGFSDIQGHLAQPGSWFYALLPWVEQEALFQVGRYHSPSLQRSRDLRQRIQTPVSVFSCPSRRDGAEMGFDPNCDTCPSPVGVMGAAELTFRGDYAVNAGDGKVDEDSPHRWPSEFSGPPDLEAANDLTRRNAWPSPPEDWSGVSWLHTSVDLAAIEDGLSNTIMVGEKYVRADSYYSGTDWGDNEPAFGGFNNDNHRSTNPHWPLRQDRFGEQSVGSFGAAHAAGASFAFCDGSVRLISYSVDTELFRSQGNRKDGAMNQ